MDVNATFTDITGYTRDEILGLKPSFLHSGRHESDFYATLWHQLIDKGHWYGEIWNRRKNGDIFIELLTISAVLDGRGKTRHYVGLFSDITLQKEHEKQLEYIAHYDALTRMPNRVLLADRMQQAMAQALRRKKLLAVVYIDLDGFKLINDLRGHQAGDHLLMTVAERMKQVLREGDTLARLGGDEFVVLLADLNDESSSGALLDRLLAAAAQPVQMGSLVLQVTASMGVTFFPQTQEMEADQLLRQADQAMYQAKIGGKRRFHFFDVSQDICTRGHYEGLERIRQALAANEFVLHYQPKVNMRTGLVVGVEALLCWQHPHRGLLTHSDFIGVLEDHPLAVTLGEWAIESALKQMRTWHDEGFDIAVSVNVGARQLQQIDFLDRLRRLLAAYPMVLPLQLELEVLEAVALMDIQQVSDVMRECRNIGVTFALDDFGTGYSSLTYLKRLPVGVIKVAPSFVRDMLSNPDDLAILGGVMGMATAFRRHVVAQGVDTVEQGELLLQLGCELAQGRCIAPPMSACAVPVWVASWQPVSAWMNRPVVGWDKFPLVCASVEHRAWIAEIEESLTGQRARPPVLDVHACRLGAWLADRQRAGYGTFARFQAIEQLHSQMHQLVNKIIDQYNSGDTVAMTDNLATLHGLSDNLSDQMLEVLYEF